MTVKISDGDIAESDIQAFNIISLVGIRKAPSFRHNSILHILFSHCLKMTKINKESIKTFMPSSMSVLHDLIESLASRERSYYHTYNTPSHGLLHIYNYHPITSGLSRLKVS